MVIAVFGPCVFKKRRGCDAEPGRTTTRRREAFIRFERNISMDSRTLSILTIAATLGFVSTPGLAEPIDDEGQRSSRRARIIERFDADGDGKLDEQERAAAHEARRAKVLERFDTNGNGMIDDAERKAIGKARKQRRLKRHQRLLERFDTNGDGQLDEQERAAARELRRAKMIERFDANGDGVLDRNEKKTARKAHRHRNRGHRQDRQPRAVPGTEA